MKPRYTWPASLRDRIAHASAVFAVALAAFEVFVDGVTWIQLDVATIYSIPLVFAAVARRQRLLWALTALLLIATFAVYSMQIAPGAFALNETFFVNRVLDAAAILVTAGLLHIWMTLLRTVDAQCGLLRDQNDRLEAANLALVGTHELIAAQNQELGRRRTEAEQASARKTRLLAATSHDIRTPVHTINLMAEVIRRTAENPMLAKQIPHMARRLQANALSLNDLISDVLDIARFDSGRVECHASTFSLNELLASKREDLLSLAEAKGLGLHAEMPAIAIWLRTDRIMLDRVIANLVTNAVKFTDSGSVVISAEMAPDRAALICVRDTGPGIASEQLSYIFDEFAQLPDPAGDRSRGWGLGLAICRRLVGFMEGSITVESALNNGTAFTVRLPSKHVVDKPEHSAESATALESHA